LNGDKFSTLAYFWTLSQQHGMLWTGSGMHPANAKASTRNDINNLGGYGGLITASPSDASPDEMIPGDIALPGPSASASSKPRHCSSNQTLGPVP
jgi:NAD(P)H dehydrogenase (quinone)